MFFDFIKIRHKFDIHNADKSNGPAIESNGAGLFYETGGSHVEEKREEKPREGRTLFHPLFRFLLIYNRYSQYWWR